MSKQKLAAARELIKEKHYAEARALLKTIDHPTARKWLAKLDEIAPEKQQSTLKRFLLPRRGRSRLYWILLSVFACILLYSCSIFGQAIGIIPTVAEMNATRTVEASTQVAVRATQDGIQQMTADAQATIIALTPPTATATITDTPTITNTPAPTLTPLPSSTSNPTDAPPEIWYTIRTANLRICPNVDECDRVAQLVSGTQIVVLGWLQGQLYLESDIWYRLSYNGQEAYVHSSLISRNPPTPISPPVQIIQPTSPIIQPVAPSLVCPHSCDEAVARGLSPEQAAQCGLDRDNDGVACYGT